MPEATLTAPYILAGALVRGQLRHIFSEVERHGGTADYLENKGWIESYFVQVKLTGPYHVIKWAKDSIEWLCREDDDD